MLHRMGYLSAAKHACVPCNRWYRQLPGNQTIADDGCLGHLQERNALQGKPSASDCPSHTG